MPSIVLNNVKVTVGASDISANVQAITLNYDADALKDTAMGNLTEINKGGVKKWGGTVQFKQDYADNAIDEVVFALIGTQAAFAARPENGAISTSNPEYSGTALFTGYAPISGSHGETAKATLAFVSASDLVRDVTP